MSHLSRDELERWKSRGLASDRDRIVAHLAICERCTELYGRILDEDMRADVGEVGARPDLVLEARELVRSKRRPATPVGSRRRFALASAVAAAVVVGLGVSLWISSPRVVAPGTDAIRGASLQPLAPIGEVRGPVVFRWASPFAADHYVVEVRDAERAVVLTLRSASEQAALPGELLARLEPRKPYQWDVVSYGAGGEAMLRSPPRSFEIVP